MVKKSEKTKNKKGRIYLDYAATTPVDPRVAKTMLPYFTTKFGNPASSLHSFGQEVREALEESREIIASALGAKSGEIIFTASATESNNTALKGIAFANRNKGDHIIISSVEHDCVLNSAMWLQSQGFEVEKLPVDKYGLVNPKDVEKAIKKNTILVSIMHANNEIGTIEPIREIGKICRKNSVYFHTDAAQSFGKIPIDVNKMNIDLLTASSHKIYGPKGAALLFVRKGAKIEPLLHGGGQEFGLRPSTVNIPAIVGFAKAVEICQKEIHHVKSSKRGIPSKTKLFDGVKKESQRLTKLRNNLIKGVLEKIPDSHLNGHPKKRLPNNANFWFEFVEGESIVMTLDSYGIASSTASACSSPKLEPSHVLLACGLKPSQAHGSLRLSLGRWTKEKDIDYVLRVLPKVVKKLRKISPFK
ncbi:MAG: cysteine desulfurase NifS [Parcubacteria group bacterium CG23_combo_of_CG06-09_8_20_14_all_35_9]|nr:MAG: cysteine desulfurase NifS [Parcubacteria group bacterium CG23_combo_of_CG06-09_8_20_14_all_35_9]